MVDIRKSRERLEFVREVGIADKSGASLILEEVLDVLVERRNGATEEELNQATDDLFMFRDWFRTYKKR